MSVVYFIQAGSDGPIKIGIAENLKARLVSLQIGHYEELFVRGVIYTAGRAEESDLHRRFAGDRLRGEWFRASSTLLTFIEINTARADDAMDPVQQCNQGRTCTCRQPLTWRTAAHSRKTATYDGGFGNGARA